MKFLQIIIFIVFGFCSLQVSAQKKTNRQAVNAKVKAPKLSTLLGNYKDSVAVTVDVGSNVIALPLQITDDKNNIYSIVSYQFLYKKVGVTEDEQTEKVSPTTTISSSYFKNTPLPPVWVSTIQKYLKQGEVLYFFDVVVRDVKGNYYLAPTLKFTIK
ncbi:MAG: hypothetical protein JSU03_02115 [Bacteroidetes bacterium]|nr:hypothetical protein [Bacteroidota bacterium]MBS1756053.1 hypothetical protein [Bacteroidota bacterium]